MPSAGHTQGHASVLIGSRAEEPSCCRAPRRIFGELAGWPALGIGTHFGGPRRQDVEARRVMSD
jgi:hypothetical protein